MRRVEGWRRSEAKADATPALVAMASRASSTSTPTIGRRMESYISRSTAGRHAVRSRKLGARQLRRGWGVVSGWKEPRSSANEEFGNYAVPSHPSKAALSLASFTLNRFCASRSTAASSRSARAGLARRRDGALGGLRNVSQGVGCAPTVPNHAGYSTTRCPFAAA